MKIGLIFFDQNNIDGKIIFKFLKKLSLEKISSWWNNQ